MPRFFRGRLRDRLKRRLAIVTWEKLRPIVLEIARVAAVAIAAYFGFRLVPVEATLKIDAPPGVTVLVNK